VRRIWRRRGGREHSGTLSWVPPRLCLSDLFLGNEIKFRECILYLQKENIRVGFTNLRLFYNCFFL